jgi:hypothetical protein
MNVAAEVFDNPIDADLTAEFLGDARHHLAVAIDDGLVVGFASAIHYVHPDKPPQLSMPPCDLFATFSKGSSAASYPTHSQILRNVFMASAAAQTNTRAYHREAVRRLLLRSRRPIYIGPSRRRWSDR